MTNPAKPPRKSAVSAAPHWLTRPEKLLFNRIISEWRTAGSPLLATDRDMVVDYVLTRSRVRELRKSLVIAQAEISEFDADRGYVLSLHKELDRATRLAAIFAGRMEPQTLTGKINRPARQSGND